MEKITICFDKADEISNEAAELLEKAYALYKQARFAKRDENEKIVQHVIDNTCMTAPMSASALLNGFEGISSQKLVGRMMHDRRVKSKRVKVRRKFVEVGEDGKPVENGAVMYATQTHNVYWG